MHFSSSAWQDPKSAKVLHAQRDGTIHFGRIGGIITIYEIRLTFASLRLIYVATVLGQAFIYVLYVVWEQQQQQQRMIKLVSFCESVLPFIFYFFLKLFSRAALVSCSATGCCAITVLNRHSSPPSCDGALGRYYQQHQLGNYTAGNPSLMILIKHPRSHCRWGKDILVAIKKMFLLKNS